MLNEIVRFEWRYHTRQPAFVAAAVLFLLLGFGLTAQGFGARNVQVHAPYLVTLSLAFLSLFSVFVVAVFGSSAVLRDTEHGLTELVFSTPVRKFDYLFGRFAGAFLASLAAVSAAVPGMILAASMPWIDPERTGPMHLAAYLWAVLVILAPNVLFSSALIFGVAALTRSAVAAHVAAVLLSVLYFVAAALTDSPLMAVSQPGAGGGILAALLDPFGLSSFFEVTRHWTIAERNSRFVALEGTLLLNRALWTGAAVAVFAVVHRSFAFRILPRSRRRAETIELADSPVEPATMPAVTLRPSGLPFWMDAYRSAAWLELRSLFRNAPMVLLLLLWMGVAVSEIRGSVDAEYNSALDPSAGLIFHALQQPMLLFGAILIVYFGAEVFWREQRDRMAAIVDATPVPSSALVAAKWTALSMLMLALVAGGVAAGLIVQVSAGHAVDLPVQLALFYFAGVPLLLYAAAALFIHAFSPGKYAGMVLVLLFLLLAQLGGQIGLDHRLWRFAAAPPIRFSDMNGFGEEAPAFHWFMLHWTVVSTLLFVLAAAVWRGTGGTVRDRLRMLESVRRPPVLALAATALLTGGWIFYNTNILNTRVSEDELLDWKAAYERTYAPLKKMPGPALRSIDAVVDLDPTARRYRASGSYSLVNRTGRPISSIVVGVRRDARGATLSIPGARLVRIDRRFGMHHFSLSPPLAPGAGTELRFSLEFARRGFIADGVQDDSVLANGSFLVSTRTFPSIGYRRGYEIGDPRERARRGLSTAERTGIEETEHVDADPSDERIRLTTTISTAGDQIAIAPGHLEKTWTANGRRMFRYRTEAPILNQFVIASARYAVARGRAGATDVEVLYHPAHRANVQHMLEAAAVSLDTFTRSFGPYPHRELRMAEVPARGAGLPFAALAMPGTLFFAEDRAFLTDARDPSRPDLVARRTAHEVAHQWWGYQVTPAAGEGSAVIVESLTKYCEILVIERMRGRGEVRRFQEMELDRYLSGRATEERSENAIVHAGRQPYLYYAKGALVMNALRERLGERAVNEALRGVMREPHPTSLDLLAHLHRVAGPDDHAFIDDSLARIVLYDFRIDAADATLRPDGRYDVRLRVSAKKVRADGRGEDTPVAMREAIDIAIEKADGSTLYERKHVLGGGVNELAMTVDTPPSTAFVDPWLLRIDRNRADNRKAIVIPVMD